MSSELPDPLPSAEPAASSQSPSASTPEPDIASTSESQLLGHRSRRNLRSRDRNQQKEFVFAVEGTVSSSREPGTIMTRREKRKVKSTDAPPVTVTSTPKRRRLNADSGDALQDVYCWECHGQCVEDALDCFLCPRTFHKSCVDKASLENPVPEGEQALSTWQCPVCSKLRTVESKGGKSWIMDLLSRDKFHSVLSFALKRIAHGESEMFVQPVPKAQFPDYYEIIFHPMDLTTLQNHVTSGKYGSTEAFLRDCEWIKHNSIIYNGPTSQVTSHAKNILKVSKREMSEIELCPDCYYNSSLRQENWFAEPCTYPHCLVWGRLKGFPYWPAKALRVNKNSVDVRFFGPHDRAWLAINQVVLLSEEPPVPIKNPRKYRDYDSSMAELKLHIDFIRKRFGSFNFAPPNTEFKPDHVRKCSVLFGEDVSIRSAGINGNAIGELGLSLADDCSVSGSITPSGEHSALDSSGRTRITFGRVRSPAGSSEGSEEMAESQTGSSSRRPGSACSSTPSVRTEENLAPVVSVADVKPIILKHRNRFGRKKKWKRDRVRKIGLANEAKVSKGVELSEIDAVEAEESTASVQEGAQVQGVFAPTDSRLSPELAGLAASDLDTVVEGANSKDHIVGQSSGFAASHTKLKDARVEEKSIHTKAYTDEGLASLDRISQSLQPDAEEELASSRTGAAQDLSEETEVETPSLVPVGELGDESGDNNAENHDSQEGFGKKKTLDLCIAKLNNALAALSPSPSPTHKQAPVQLPNPVQTNVRQINKRAADGKFPTQPTVSSWAGGSNSEDSTRSASLSIAEECAAKISEIVQARVDVLIGQRLSVNGRDAPGNQLGNAQGMQQTQMASGAEIEIRELKDEVRRIKWMHQQSLKEMQHSTKLALTEAHNAFEAEKTRSIEEVKRACEEEKNKIVAYTKTKQWCANCSKEAVFYCCWNTSYCDYPCQQVHWHKHMETCAQINREAVPHGILESQPSISQAPHNQFGLSTTNTLPPSLSGTTPANLTGINFHGNPGAITAQLGPQFAQGMGAVLGGGGQHVGGYHHPAVFNKTGSAQLGAPTSMGLHGQQASPGAPPGMFRQAGNVQMRMGGGLPPRR